MKGRLIRYLILFLWVTLILRAGERGWYTQRIAGFEGNHTFTIAVNETRTFEYLIAGAWNEGAVYNTPDAFVRYVRLTALEYNNPVGILFGKIETREEQTEPGRTVRSLP